MTCKKCNAVIKDGSNFCSKCGAKCGNVESSNTESNVESNQFLVNEKIYCRNCKVEITKGTLCHKCLNSMDQDLLTVAERKQKNDSIENIGCTLAFFGVIIIVTDIILFFSSVINLLPCFVMVGIGLLFFIPLFVTAGKACPACQRRNTMQKTNTELVGTRNTYVKEKRKIVHTRKNGKTYINETPDYDEYEVDVPATEYHYDVTYKCNKCGHVVVQREVETQKD